MRILHLDEQTGWRGQGLASRGHDVWVVGRKGSPFLTSKHGGARLKRISLPLRGEFDIYSAWRLARICSREHRHIDAACERGGSEWRHGDF